MRKFLKYALRGGGKILALFTPSQKWREFFNYQIPAKIYQKFFIKNTIFLSMGVDCRPALHLKAHLLRKLSAPLDWIMCYSLNDAYALYKSDFAKCFETCSEDKSKANKGKCFVVADNGMVAMHHFPINVSVAEYLPTFKCVMQRRFTRLRAQILKSKCVVFVCHRNESIESLGDFALKMSDLIESWGDENANRAGRKRVLLVNILHNENARGFDKQVYKVSEM